MTAILQFKNIEKKYNDKAIIKDFNLEIEQGEFLCMIGSSGSGKTTLLKMINGLILPDHGSVLVNGKNSGGGFNYPAPQYRLLHSRQRAFPAYECRRKYILCA